MSNTQVIEAAQKTFNEYENVGRQVLSHHALLEKVRIAVALLVETRGALDFESNPYEQFGKPKYRAVSSVEFDLEATEITLIYFDEIDYDLHEAVFSLEDLPRVGKVKAEYTFTREKSDTYEHSEMTFPLVYLAMPDSEVIEADTKWVNRILEEKQKLTKQKEVENEKTERETLATLRAKYG